jgi:putative ABC transport system permease protein
MNFGITVILGFLVGTAIAGQTFYLFTIENLRQFGALKSMGLSNLRIVGMILLQAALVGLLGYAIGVGLAAVFGHVADSVDKLAFYMPWPILLGTGVAVGLIMVASSLISIRRVLVLEPGIVFRS